MRTRMLTMVTVLLLVSAGAGAQTTTSQPAQSAAGQQSEAAATPATSTEPETIQQTAPPPSSGIGAIFDHAFFGPAIVGLTDANQISFGVRGTKFSDNSDRARFQRYQDLTNGATIDLFRYARNTDTSLLKLQGNDIGFNDQRLSIEYNKYGKVKASFLWNQIPDTYSYTTQTLYNQAVPGQLTIPIGIRTAIQNGATVLGDAVNGAPAFTLGEQWNIADFNLTYTLNPTMDLKVWVKNTQRNGNQPWAGSFGFSYAADQMPVPIDRRTTDVGSAFEWSNGNAFAKGGYGGSFFRNNVSTLTWDNPLRASDSATLGPAAGRESLWPDTNENTVNASVGMTRLPGHSTATAYLSYGRESNNAPLIPFTDNSALASPALPRSAADMSAQITALNFGFTSRPTRRLSFNARYRQYEFNDNSAPFASPVSVGYDVSLAGPIEADILGFKRHTFDADLAYTPISLFSIRAGYTRENVDYTARFVDRTTENAGRISADLIGRSWISLRGIYEHRSRQANGFNPLDVLADNEQPGLNQYDIASRNQDRASGILVITPISMFSVNASVTYSKVTYPANGAQTINPAYEQFGLFDTKGNTYSIGADFVPVENKAVIGATYSYERYSALQASRNAGHVATGVPPQFFMPNNDWFDNSADRIHTVDVSADLVQIAPRVDLRLSYTLSDARSTYLYSLPPVTVLTTPNQLAPVKNNIQTGTIDCVYHLTQRLLLGATYWYSKYSVNDFAFGPQPGGLVVPQSGNPSLMMIGYTFLPYNGSTLISHVSYLW